MGATKYNGVILPDLPDYDRNTYPYALICKTVDTDGYYGYVLLVCSEALTQDRYYGNSYNYSTNAKIAGYSVVDTGSTYRWSLGQINNEYGDTLQYRFSGEYVWSDYDVCLRNDPVPILPTWNSVQYPYLIIVNHDRESADALWRNDYFAYYSAEPFTGMKYPDGYGAVEGYETTNGAAYFANTETLGRQEFDQEWISEYVYTTEGWKIPYDGEFDDYLPNTLIGSACVLTEDGGRWSNVWANHAIYDTAGVEKIHEANSWYNLVVYTEGTTEDVTVFAPTNVVAEGGGTYNQYDTAYALNCTADAPEGGFLSYKWYRNGTVCGYNQMLIPSTGTAGTFEYYCVVTNTQYGEKVSARSASLTVVVNAVDLPDDPEVDPEAEQELIKARTRKHAIGYVLHQCGVPMAEMIAEMLGKVNRSPEVFNLSDFGGYYNSQDDKATANDIKTEFGMGGAPLTFVTKHINWDAVNAGINIYFEDLPFRAGDDVELTYIYPKGDFGALKYDGQWHSISMFSGTTGVGLHIRDNYFNDGKLTCTNQNMFETYEFDEVKDSDGQRIGVILRGILATNFIKLTVSHYAADVTTTLSSFTIKTTYSDYDSVKITRR